MSRLLISAAAATVGLVSLSSVALAQTDAQRTGCTRDVTRLCRAVINDGDSAVLSCLQQNRAKVSKACQKILSDNGQ